MLRVYGHYTYFYTFSAGIDFRHQILMSKVDLRTVRAKLCNWNFHPLEIVPC